MRLVVWLSRAWGPLCFAVLAALGLANLWQTSRTVAGTGPFSPPDSVEETDRRFEAVRQSLLYRTAVGDHGNNRAVREPVGSSQQDMANDRPPRGRSCTIKPNTP